MATSSRYSEGEITIASRRLTAKETEGVLGASLDGLPKHVLQQRTFPLGKYRGLSFGVVLHPQFPPEVYLEGAVTRQSRLSRDHHGPRAVLNALERLVGGFRAV